MAGDYKNIGVVLGQMDEYQEARRSHNKALKMDEESNDRVGLAADYSNIGVALHRGIGNVLDDLDDYQEALDSYNIYYDMSFVLSKTNKEDALKSIYNALTI